MSERRRKDDNPPTQPMIYQWPQVILDDKTKNLLIRAQILADSRKYLANPVPFKDLIK
jgi:hypothetical protein